MCFIWNINKSSYFNLFLALTYDDLSTKKNLGNSLFIYVCDTCAKANIGNGLFECEQLLNYPFVCYVSILIYFAINTDILTSQTNFYFINVDVMSTMRYIEWYYFIIGYADYIHLCYYIPHEITYFVLPHSYHVPLANISLI